MSGSDSRTIGSKNQPLDISSTERLLIDMDTVKDLIS